MNHHIILWHDYIQLYLVTLLYIIYCLFINDINYKWILIHPPQIPDLSISTKYISPSTLGYLEAPIISNTDNVSPDGQLRPDNCVGLRFRSTPAYGQLGTVGYAGLLQTMPDYFRSTTNYAGLLSVYYGPLCRTQGFSIPAPRTSLGLRETIY